MAKKKTSKSKKILKAKTVGVAKKASAEKKVVAKVAGRVAAKRALSKKTATKKITVKKAAADKTITKKKAKAKAKAKKTTAAQKTRAVKAKSAAFAAVENPELELAPVETPVEAKMTEKVAKKPKKVAKKRGKRKTKKSSVAEQEGFTWQGLNDHLAEVEAGSYRIDGQFDVGQKISHKKFGLGFVVRLVPPNKMDVIFENETRLLIKGQQEITDEIFGLE